MLYSVDMKMKAAVRDPETTQTMIIERDYYESKKEFREELRRNGFVVISRVVIIEDEDTNDDATC